MCQKTWTGNVKEYMKSEKPNGPGIYPPKNFSNCQVCEVPH